MPTISPVATVQDHPLQFQPSLPTLTRGRLKVLSYDFIVSPYFMQLCFQCWHFCTDILVLAVHKGFSPPSKVSNYLNKFDYSPIDCYSTEMPSHPSPHHETWYLSYKLSREILLPSFNYSNNGRVFLQDGTIFYSPNCSRPAIIPLQTNYSSPPFNQPPLNSSMFKQPIWWTEFGASWALPHWPQASRPLLFLDISDWTRILFSLSTVDHPQYQLPPIFCGLKNPFCTDDGSWTAF